MFHWTDSKIRVHVFTCVLALTVAHLMRRQADRRRPGPQRPRTPRPPSPASKKPSCSTPPPEADPAPDACSPTQTPTQQHLFDLFNLTRYAPT